MKNRVGFNKNDLLLLVVILAVAGAVFVFSATKEPPQHGKAVVTVDGKVIKELSLNEDAVFEISSANGTNLLVIQDGKADMTEASCPDSICVRHRPIEKAGESIICLPNKVAVTIEEGAENGVDLEI